MKQILILLAFVMSLGSAFSQDMIEMTTGTTLAPTTLATRLLETGTLASLSPFATTINAAQARGVAGKEQLRDELHSFNDDFVAGRVQVIEDVRQPALKELFIEIAQDDNQMSDIETVIPEGTELFKVATAVTVALLVE